MHILKKRSSFKIRICTCIMNFMNQKTLASVNAMEPTLWISSNISISPFLRFNALYKRAFVKPMIILYEITLSDRDMFERIAVGSYKTTYA